MDMVWIKEIVVEDRHRWLPNTGHFTFGVTSLTPL